jgi:nucleoside-diphosphate-sugar epimerase
MKILFIGGNGNISWQCTQKAIERGHEVWQLNREQTVLTRRRVQPEVHKLKGDIRQPDSIKELLVLDSFDVVCDFICYNAEHARNDIDIFKNMTKHFVFISSESVYRRVSSDVPFSEQSEQYDADACDCGYISGKVNAEKAFMNAYESDGFPITIVRPAYTYDTIFPISIGHNCFTASELILKGYPLLIAGDGTNRYNFNHSADFAEAFVGLIENPDITGESFQIATDEALTWNEQSEIVLKALEAEASGVYHVPHADALELEDIQPHEMMRQRMWDSIYCLDKIKSYVPGWSAKISFEEGISRTLRWLNEDTHHKRHTDAIENALNAVYRKYGLMK